MTEKKHILEFLKDVYQEHVNGENYYLATQVLDHLSDYKNHHAAIKRICDKNGIEKISSVIDDIKHSRVFINFHNVVRMLVHIKSNESEEIIEGIAESMEETLPYNQQSWFKIDDEYYKYYRFHVSCKSDGSLAHEVPMWVPYYFRNMVRKYFEEQDYEMSDFDINGDPLIPHYYAYSEHIASELLYKQRRNCQTLAGYPERIWKNLGDGKEVYIAKLWGRNLIEVKKSVEDFLMNEALDLYVRVMPTALPYLVKVMEAIKKSKNYNDRF